MGIANAREDYQWEARGDMYECGKHDGRDSILFPQGETAKNAKAHAEFAKTRVPKKKDAAIGRAF